MKSLMLKYFLFSTVFVFSVFFCVDGVCSKTNGSGCLIDFNEDGTARYSVNMTFKNVGLSGVSLFKDESDVIKGCLINEFGVKAFDFIYYKAKKKLKVFNAIKFLDKWYIRKTISADLLPLFCSSSNRRTKVYIESNVIVIDNSKRDIKYMFKKIL